MVDLINDIRTFPPWTTASRTITAHEIPPQTNAFTGKLFLGQFPLMKFPPRQIPD